MSLSNRSEAVHSHYLFKSYQIPNLKMVKPKMLSCFVISINCLNPDRGFGLITPLPLRVLIYYTLNILFYMYII